MPEYTMKLEQHMAALRNGKLAVIDLLKDGKYVAGIYASENGISIPAVPVAGKTVNETVSIAYACFRAVAFLERYVHCASDARILFANGITLHVPTRND